MQQRNKRAKTRPCVRSTRAREEAAKSRSYEALAKGFDQSVAATMSHGQQKPKQKANFLFAVSFAFLLLPFFFFFFPHPENNFFCPLLNKKVFFLTKFLYFSTKKLAYSFWSLFLNARFLFFFQFCPALNWTQGTTDKTLTGIFPFVYSVGIFLIFG
jgi:hypothetical protein